MSRPEVYFLDCIVTLDKPRRLLGNPRSAAHFKELTGVDILAYNFDESAGEEHIIRGLMALLAVMAREADPDVDPAAIVGAVTPESLPRIMAELSAALGRN